MIHVIEKFLNIAFQHKARTCAVFRDFLHRLFQRANSLVRAESDATRERCRDERRLENWIEHRRYSMMENSVSDCRFVDMPLLGIVDIKTRIPTVLIGFIFQFAVEFEYVFFKIPFELNHVNLFSFVALKGVPS